MIIAGVADDFTGANDCAGRFAAAGFKAWSSPSLHYWPQAEAGVGNAETRFLAAPQARARSRAAWAGVLGRFGIRCGFQKIDSTLRGQPGSEVLGLLEAAGPRKIAFCPAYPVHGRTVLAGRVQVHGVDLSRTEYARDPLTPALSAGVADHFPAGLVRQLPRAGTARLRSLIRASRSRVLSFDARSTADLDRIAAACLGEGIRFFVGASGLAGALAAQLRPHGRPSSRPALPARRVVLAGSVSATSFEQLSRLEHSGLAPWFDLIPAQYLGRHGKRPLRPATRALKIAFSTLGNRALLPRIRRSAAKLGLSRRELADQALAALVKMALNYAKPPIEWLWLVTGGHTAETFFRMLNLKGGQVFGELMPGLPLMAAQDGKGRTVLVCSKPGGFGSADTLTKFMELK